MSSDRQKNLHIVVSALTRGRPEMLKALLGSFGEMAIPTATRVQCMIVENDDTPASARVVNAYAQLPNGVDVIYVHEPELGIPFGRNRAAKEAIALGADLLAYVDDDEVVAEDWLTEIVSAYRNSAAVLIGGPLRVKPTERDLSMLDALMEKCIVRRYEQKERRAARKADLNGTPGVTIVTNNWLGETAIFTHHNIWFDEEMRFTGGTDSKLYAEVKAANLPTAWAETAAVYEEIPLERLSMAYQFRRGRDQSSTNFHRKLERSSAARFSVLGSIPIKIVIVAGLIIALPLTRGRTLLDAVRTTGWMAGRIQALFGRRSDLYRKVTGD
ncbi:glycosyltransferase family A protein [uncultured Tateyamaria sp.]|uniref:glycosyltransferase family 2 protein n=1 Tax=uncultured Tateyamaria sp. TaxID=455651 RepID=UPI002619DF9F|nr:glycosyltransferase family A protein [uncultured Tateyamaria sp.]